MSEAADKLEQFRSLERACKAACLERERIESAPEDKTLWISPSIAHDFSAEASPSRILNLLTFAEEQVKRADEAISALFKRELETWKNVSDTDIFYDLKHGKFRDILLLLSDGVISIGKAAGAITERAHGVEPLLPDYEIPAADPPSWRELAEAAEAEVERLRKLQEQWTPTAQRVPELGRWCRTVYKGYVQECPARITEDLEWEWAENDVDHMSLHGVSHWMYIPLPEPPKEGE